VGDDEPELHPLLIFMADSDCAVICGDGQIEGGEQCDDGNTAGGDGCSATCQNEFVASPAVSEWGLIALALTMLIAAKIWFAERRERTTGNAD
jgi:cysteine-rich repeat protein